MALIRNLKPGDTLRIGDSVITMEPKTGQSARLRIDSTLKVTQTKAGEAPAPAVPTAPSPPVPAAPAAPEAAPAPMAAKPTLFRPYTKA